MISSSARRLEGVVKAERPRRGVVVAVVVVEEEGSRDSSARDGARMLATERCASSAAAVGVDMVMIMRAYGIKSTLVQDISQEALI